LLLKDLLVGSRSSVEQFKKRMTTDGWAFVELPQDLQSLVEAATKPLESFFAQDFETKRKYHDNFQGTDELDGPVYGFNQTEAKTKEGLRLLTGGRLKKNWIPEECAETIFPLVGAMDRIMLRFIEATAQQIFGMKIDLLAEKYDLPLLIGAKEHQATAFNEKNFAMFDVAYYPNQKPTVQDLNVAGHYDPGLFSFSFLSTQAGLQVRTKDGVWIDCPTSRNLGIIWAGEIAQTICKEVQPGWHRVKYDSNQIPRLSAWIEVCTAAQDLSFSNTMLENIKFPSSGLFYLPGVDLTDYQNAAARKEPLGVVYVQEGESLAGALQKASRLYGMPMTKSIRYYCPLCLTPVSVLQDHFFEVHPSKQQVIPKSTEVDAQFQSLFPNKGRGNFMF